MGEARQRRLAREAGRPWPVDAPPRRLATQDFKKIEEERSPLVTVDSRGDDGQLQRLEATARRAPLDVVVVSAEPRPLPSARRRPNMFQIMALLAASSLDDVRKPR